MIYEDLKGWNGTIFDIDIRYKYRYSSTKIMYSKVLEFTKICQTWTNPKSKYSSERIPIHDFVRLIYE